LNRAVVSLFGSLSKGDIELKKRVKNRKEEDCGGEDERQGDRRDRSSRSCALEALGCKGHVAMPHFARAAVALLSEGRGCDGADDKGVRMVDKVDEGIADIGFDGDCEPRRREQLACDYAATGCRTDGVVQPIAEITFLSIVFGIRPQRQRHPGS